MPTSYELSACPACGAQSSTEIASRDSIVAEMEALWSFHLRRLRPDTPPDHLTDRLAFTQDPPLRVARCDDCGTLRRDPRERALSVVGRYAEEPLGDAVLRSLFEAQRDAARAQAARLARHAGPGGDGVEVGCYAGSFLVAARERGWRFHGVDVNADAVDFARSLGFPADEATLETLPPDARYDAVAVWNCFEQLPDARGTLEAARRRLRPGGTLVLRVPDGDFYRRWRGRLEGAGGALAVALLAHNNLLGFPYRTGFTPGSLRRLLVDEGFRVVALHPDVLVPIADRWTRPWAAREERLLKALLRRLPGAPWFEVYARRS